MEGKEADAHRERKLTEGWSGPSKKPTTEEWMEIEGGGGRIRVVLERRTRMRRAQDGRDRRKKKGGNDGGSSLSGSRDVNHNCAMHNRYMCVLCRLCL